MEFLSIFGWNFAELTKFEKHSFQFYIQGYLHLKMVTKENSHGGLSQTTFTDFWPFWSPPLML